MLDPNRAALRDRLRRFVDAMGPRIERIALVGGTAPALYPLEGSRLRMTVDIDVILDASTLAEWHRVVGDLESINAFGGRKKKMPPSVDM